ncbi:MAG: hypothetical protein AB1Z19_07645 [Eubacteriales bacterium]
MILKKTRLALLVIMFVVMLSACAAKSGLTEDDLVFQYDGGSFALNSDASKLVDALGDDYTFSEAVSCAYTGMDKVYQYDGIMVFTYPLDDIDHIDEIYITSDAYSTAKGITVGSTLQDIQKAYGEDAVDADGDGLLVLTPDGPRVDTDTRCLYFVMDGETVLEFSFYSASNRQ